MILLGYLQLKMVTYNGMLTFNPYMVQPIQGQYLYINEYITIQSLKTKAIKGSYLLIIMEIYFLGYQPC